MYDDGLLGDAIANDGVYTAELPYLNSGQEIKFYIRSHNNAISLSPQRAEYEFYTFHPNVNWKPYKKLITSKFIQTQAMACLMFMLKIHLKSNVKFSTYMDRSFY